MRNRIAGIMHWEHVGIAHASPPRKQLAPRPPVSRRPYVALATATLAAFAVVVTLRALVGALSARA